MMSLSTHFTLPEFLRSESAARHDISMEPSTTVVANLTHLAREVLDPIREAAGCPIIVTSGYRPHELNALIGGAANSDHLYGLAADIHALGHDVDWLLAVIRRIAPMLPIKKAIDEFHAWVHVSIDLGNSPKREFLVATREAGKTVYRTWEVV